MDVTRAIILVGGEGTRLRPLTHGTPKAMVPILNRPLLEHMLVYMARHGITTIHLALGHQPDAIRAYFGDGARWGINLKVAVEPEPLGSGGAIKQFERELDGPFFAFNGDILTDMNLYAMAELHRDAGAATSIGLIEVDDPSGFGVARLDANGRIVEFVEKPPRDQAPSRWANAGVWLFQPDVLERVPAGRRTMVETALFPELIAAGGHVQGYRERCFWVDVGTPQRYLEAQLRMLAEPRLRILPLSTWPGTPYLSADEDTATAPPFVDRDARIEGAVLLGAGCRVEAGAHIAGPAVVGNGVVIGQGAQVARSVLWDGVVVEREARVRDTSLAFRSVVGAGATLERCVLGDDVGTGPGVHLADAKLDPPHVTAVAG